MKLWHKALACLAAVATLASVSVLASAQQGVDEVPQDEKGSSQQSGAPSDLPDSSKGGPVDTAGTNSTVVNDGQKSSDSSGSSTSKDPTPHVAQSNAPLAKSGALPAPSVAGSQPAVSAQSGDLCNLPAYGWASFDHDNAAKWEGAPDGNGGCTINVHDGQVALRTVPWKDTPSMYTTNWAKLVSKITFENATVFTPSELTATSAVYNHSADGMFAGLPNLKTVDISGLQFTNTGENDVGTQKMFANDPKLTEIIGLENLDTSHVYNMSQMFADDPLLTTLDLHRWQVENVKDMSEMFTGDSALTRVNLSGWNTQSLGEGYRDPEDLQGLRTDLIIGGVNGMFADDTSLKTVDLSGWQTGGVRDFSNMFSSCSSLTTIKGIEDSDWNNRPARWVHVDDDYRSDDVKMSDMFKGASALTKLDLSHFNTSKVTDMSGMFSGMAKLQSVNVSNWEVTKVKDFSGMFDNASSLTEIPGIDTWTFDDWSPGVDRSTAYMFQGASSLKSIDLTNWPVRLTSRITDMSSMFADDTSLKSIDFSGLHLPRVTSLSGIFAGDTALQNVKLAYWDVPQVTNISGLFEGDKALEHVDLSKWNAASVSNANNITDMSNLFANQTSLKTVDLTDFNTSKVTNMSGMFLGDTKLTEVKGLKDLDTSNVTDMSNMFATVDRLKALPEQPAEAKVGPQDDEDSQSAGINFDDIKGWNVGKVQKFDQMFMGRDDLGKLDLSQWKPGEQVAADPAQSVSMRGMFAGDAALTDLKDVAAWNTGKVSDMSYMFYQCKSLAKLGDLSNWKTDNVTNMEGMFRYDSQLKDVRGMSTWNTGNVKSMAGMFQRNRKRSDLGDVSGWNTSNVEQMWDMFGGDSNLKKIDVSQWNTSNVKSMTYMFQGTALKSLDLSNWNTTKVQDVPAQNIQKCSQNEAKTTDGTCKILPENLQEVTVGDATKLKAESFSEDPMDTDGYTGSWVSDDNSWASDADNANQDLANHLQASGSGSVAGPQDESETPHTHTYRWQESASVTFDANLPEGAKLTSPVPDAIIALGAQINGSQRQIPSKEPKAEGYEFEGWNTTFDGGKDGTNQLGKAYKAGDPVTLSRGRNITLYAQWKTLSVPASPLTPANTATGSIRPHYVVHYDANAPEGAEATGAMEDDAFDVVIAENGNKLYQPHALADNGFRVDGYAFTGWSRKSSDEKGTKIYRPGTKLNMKPGTNTVFAHWQKVDSSAAAGAGNGSSANGTATGDGNGNGTSGSSSANGSAGNSTSNGNAVNSNTGNGTGSNGTGEAASDTSGDAANGTTNDDSTSSPDEDDETVVVTVTNPAGAGQGVQIQAPAPALAMPSQVSQVQAQQVQQAQPAQQAQRAQRNANAPTSPQRDGMVAPTPITPKKSTAPKCLPRPVAYEGSAQDVAWFASSNSAALPYCDSEDKAAAAAPSAQANLWQVAALWIVIAAAMLALCGVAAWQRFGSFALAMVSHHREGNWDE